MTSREGSDGRGHVFVIAAPSGTGKTTICRHLLERDPGLRLSISHTTRKPREGEEHGVDYHFVTAEAFRELGEADGFLEHAEYGGNVYGTSWRAIEEPLESGHDVLLEIEVQGAAQVRERRPSACLIFILPPNLDVLEDRLRVVKPFQTQIDTTQRVHRSDVPGLILPKRLEHFGCGLGIVVGQIFLGHGESRRVPDHEKVEFGRPGIVPHHPPLGKRKLDVR